MLRLDADQILIESDVDLEASTGQFGPSSEPIGDTIFLGIGGERPVGGDFDIGGAVSAKVPFKGQVELFRAQVEGSITGRFGLEFVWEFDPGSVDIVQNYDIAIAVPGEQLAVTDVYNVATQAVFDPTDPDGGYSTVFPKLSADLNAILELAAQLQATYGVLGKNRTDEIFDFDLGVSIPIFSFETGRVDEFGNANEFEVFGATTTEVLENLDAPVSTFDGVYTVQIEDLYGTRTAEEEVPVDLVGDEEPEFEADVTTTQQIDLGQIVLDIPDFSVSDDGFDEDLGAYVTDEDTNKENIIELTLDVDGIATQATGGGFPPLELTSETDIEVGPATISADFTYNLIDVELIGGLPLVQFFTVTPDVETRMTFFETDGVTAKSVDVQLTRKTIIFDVDGVFQSAAVETRLKELAQDSAKFATDIDLFVDFDAGIPGAFTGDTASIAGAVVSRPAGSDAAFTRIDNQESVAQSAPVLGEDQDAPVPVPGETEFAYAIFITDADAPGGERTEIIPLDFAPIGPEDPTETFPLTDTIWREEMVTATEAITETPWYGEEGEFDVVYDTDTVVKVETRAGGEVRNQTGLGLTLDVLLQGLAASAEFGIDVDLGLFDFGGSIGIGFDELFSRTFNIFDFTDSDEILTLFDETFEVDKETSEIVEVADFLVGPGTQTGEDTAIRGTEGNDPLNGTQGDDVIIGLGGTDTLQGFGGNDTILPGEGSDTVRGNDGIDRVSYEDFLGAEVDEFILVGGFILAGPGEVAGLEIAGTRTTVLGDGTVDFLSTIEEARGSNFNDLIIADGDLQLIDAGRGDDIIELVNNRMSAFGGDGDDQFIEISMRGNRHTLDGGEGDDGVSFDTSRAVDIDLIDRNDSADTFLSIESFFLPENSNFDHVFLDDDEAHSVLAGAGDDSLSGRGGRDVLRGNEGDDTISGGLGADILEGGDGRDRLSYRDAATSVFIRLDPHLNGTTGEINAGRGFRGEAQGDQIGGFEDLEGSQLNDILFGDAGDNRIFGFRGDDRLAGQGGNDSLFGGLGDDILWRGDNAGRTLLRGDYLFNGGDGFDIVAFDYGGEDIITTGGGLTSQNLFARLGVNGADGVATTSGSFFSEDAGGTVTETNTDVLRDVEGIIGGEEDDEIVGNNEDNALFGTGGFDYIAGAGGDDVLGFGSAQPLSRTLSFPGDSANNDPGETPPPRAPRDFELVLQRLNPDALRGEVNALSDSDLATILAIPTSDVIRSHSGKSFLWGGAGQDTLDMRFDRGLAFFPEESDRSARVLLDAFAGESNPPVDLINDFTGEQLVYGTATLDDPEDSEDPVETAILFGIEHVIGGAGDDDIFGNALDNTIEGENGADFLFGGAGLDTLSYINADGGIGISVTTNADQTKVVALGITAPDGSTDHHATGDEAQQFEIIVGSDFSDQINAGFAEGDPGDLITKDVSALYAGPTDVRGYRDLGPEFDFTLFGGEGNDSFAIGAFGQHEVFGGAGNDRVVTRGTGSTLDLGEGDDEALYLGVFPDLLFFDPDTNLPTAETEPGILRNVFRGGDGVDVLSVSDFLYDIDRIVLFDDRVLVVETPGPEVLDGLDPAVASALGGTELRQTYFDFELIDFDFDFLAEVDLRNLDPVVQADKELVITEDQNDPIPIGLEATDEDIAADNTFQLTRRPDGGQLVVIREDGSQRPVGNNSILSLDEMTRLHFITDQSYDFDTGPVTFDVLETGASGTAAIPIARGVDLGIDLPVDLEGEALEVTIDELPDQGTVFFIEELPTPLGFGTPLKVEVVLQVGDEISAEQLSELRYRPELDDRGPAGNFSYTVRDPNAFDDDGLTQLFDDRRDGADGRDGVAGQTISIRIAGREDAPKSLDQIFEFSPGLIFDDQLIGADPDGDEVIFQLVQGLTSGEVRQTEPVAPPGQGEEPDFTRDENGDLGSLTLNPNGGFSYTPPDASVFQAGDLFFETSFIFRVREKIGDKQVSTDHEVTLRVVNPDAQQILFVDPNDPNQQVNPDPEEGEQPDFSLKELGGQDTSDHIRGHGGVDRIFGLTGEDMIEGFQGDDKLSGGEDNDTLLGGLGNDTLMGGEGADMLDGESGMDYASYDDAGARVRMDLAGLVSSLGDAVGDQLISIENLIGSRFNDDIRGDSGDNILMGGNSGDRIFGRSGDDTLFGELGVDKLYGNRGADVMFGGDGNDRFIYFGVDDSGVGAGQRDVIGDWEDGDRIEISRLDADTTRGGNQVFDFIGTAQFSGAAGELRHVRQAVNDLTLVQADTDGDGQSDFQIELTGIHVLDAGDFVL
ncbi:MAG: calcium-binding protein [Pseudomonadota bacterium]